MTKEQEFAHYRCYALGLAHELEDYAHDAIAHIRNAKTTEDLDGCIDFLKNLNIPDAWGI